MRPLSPQQTSSAIGVRWKRLLCVLVTAAAGCSNLHHEPTVELEITASGAYTVDGKLVERDRLADVLRSKRQPGHQLTVRILPSSTATYAAVTFAVEACQAVGAYLGMVGNMSPTPVTRGSGT